MIVLLEFALNTQGDPAAYERLLRQILAIRPAVAVIAVNIHKWRPQHAHDQHKQCSTIDIHAQPWHDADEDAILKLCQRYMVPVVSIRAALMGVVRAGDEARAPHATGRLRTASELSLHGPRRGSVSPLGTRIASIPTTWGTRTSRSSSSIGCCGRWRPTSLASGLRAQLIKSSRRCMERRACRIQRACAPTERASVSVCWPRRASCSRTRDEASPATSQQPPARGCGCSSFQMLL